MHICRLNAVKQTVENLKAKLKDTTESKLSAEERSNRIEDALKQEERYQATMMIEVKELGDVLFRRNTELLNMKSEKRTLETEMQVSNSFGFTENISLTFNTC